MDVERLMVEVEVERLMVERLQLSTASSGSTWWLIRVCPLTLVSGSSTCRPNAS